MAWHTDESSKRTFSFSKHIIHIDLSFFLGGGGHDLLGSESGSTPDLIRIHSEFEAL
jgi:hypothetical protein